ncbi:MAG: tetratricopeptide repeat protein, partial [Candidatus Njordarchaeota archaeon]
MATILLRSSTTSQYPGTLLYCAPEQINPKKFGKVDQRTDVWQFGCLLYEMIEGKPPFQMEYSPLELIAKITEDEPEEPEKMPNWIKAIVYKSLAKNKEDRWRSISIIIEYLKRKDALPDNTALIQSMSSFAESLEEKFYRAIQTQDTESLSALLEELKAEFEETGETKYALMYDTIRETLGKPPLLLYKLVLENPKHVEQSANLLNNVHVFTTLGNIYLDLFKLDKAKQYFEKALEKHNEFPDALVGLAEVYYLERNFEKTIEIARKVLDISQSIRARYVLRRSLNWLRMPEKDYITIPDIKPSKFREIIAKALFHEFFGEHDKAIEILDNMPDEFKMHFNALYAYGDIYYSLGKEEKAKEYLEKTISMNPYHAKAYMWLGKIFMDKKDYRTAISYFIKTVNIYPYWSYAFNELAMCYYFIKDYEKTLYYLEKAIQANKYHAMPYYNIAVIYVIKLGNTEMAKRYIRQCPKEALKDFLDRYTEEINKCYYKINREDIALKLSRVLVEALPDLCDILLSPGHISAIGGIYILLGDFNNAERCLKKAYEMNPNSAHINLNLASLYYNR